MHMHTYPEAPLKAGEACAMCSVDPVQKTFLTVAPNPEQLQVIHFVDCVYAKALCTLKIAANLDENHLFFNQYDMRSRLQV